MIEIMVRDEGNGRSTRWTRHRPGTREYPAMDEQARAERRRAVLLGTRDGRSIVDLSIQLGIASRTVIRERARLRAEGLLP